MEELKYSIVVCAYKNHRQFSNFIWTACCQDFNGYEVVVVDNATPNDLIFRMSEKAQCSLAKVRYFNIEPEQKRCKNITQGINLAVSKAVGKYVVIVADSNVLLSFNLLSSIDRLIDDDTVVLSSGTNDVKISPDGNYDSEYWLGDPQKMAELNYKLLIKMGWPCDPINLDLSKVGYRFPPPHRGLDCYIVALAKSQFLQKGGYDESKVSWGEYHQEFVKRMLDGSKLAALQGVRIVHQFHRVFKDDSN